VNCLVRFTFLESKMEMTCKMVIGNEMERGGDGDSRGRIEIER
jgi:hypothetical protein